MSFYQEKSRPPRHCVEQFGDPGCPLHLRITKIRYSSVLVSILSVIGIGRGWAARGFHLVDQSSLLLRLTQSILGHMRQFRMLSVAHRGLGESVLRRFQHARIVVPQRAPGSGDDDLARVIDVGVAILAGRRDGDGLPGSQVATMAPRQ